MRFLKQGRVNSYSGVGGAKQLLCLSVAITPLMCALPGFAQQEYVREEAGITYSQLDNPYVSGQMPQAHMTLSAGHDASYEEFTLADVSTTFGFEFVAGAWPASAGADLYAEGWPEAHWPGKSALRSDRTMLMFPGNYSAGDTIFFENRGIHLGHDIVRFAWKTHSSDANTIPPPHPVRTSLPPVGFLKRKAGDLKRTSSSSQ